MPLQSCGWDANIAEKQTTRVFKVKCMNYSLVQIHGDQKVHLMIAVQKTRKKYFKQFHSLTMIT
jgi:hypothetical protein